LLLLLLLLLTMMFLKTAFLLLAVSWSSGVVAADDDTTTTTITTFTPYRISLKALKGGCQHSQTQLKEALATQGMVSVTDIGNDFRLNKKQTLSLLLDEEDECNNQASAFSKEHVFGDGTRRRTLATHTVNGEMKAVTACEAFEQASTAFRHQVAEVTEAFAKRLESLVENVVERPLLTMTQSGETLDTISQVVEHGEHLEHFHSYSSSSSSTPVEEEENNMDTIEMHTDQGMFLVFTPGQTPNNNHELTDGFFIQLSDGSRVMVNFDQDDELVFMLGDGIHQVLISDNNNKDLLYATPHALQMTARDVRVWYGRMVLPPANAISPQHSDMTFGDIRNLVRSAGNDDKEILSLGCSSPHQRALQTVGGDESCTADQLWCWHRCLNLTETVSADACKAVFLDLACINSERQLWGQAHDPDFEPGCVDMDTAVFAPIPSDAPSTNPSEAMADGAVVMTTSALSWTLVVASASVFAALRM
jgi:hypothetical protein